MKRLELIGLYNGLKGIRSLKGKSEDVVKFRYAVEKNLSRLEREIIRMEKSIEYTEGFKNYQNERLTLLKTRAKKDESGNPVIKEKSKFGDVYDIENMDVFVKESEELKEKYKKDIEEYDDMTKKYNSFLEEETDFELYKITLNRIPDDISNEQMQSVLLIIEE